MSVSKAIKQRLIDLNMTQVELAEAIGSTRQNLSNKLVRDNFTAKELSKICDVLKLTIVLKSADKKEYEVKYIDWVLNIAEKRRKKWKQ